MSARVPLARSWPKCEAAAALPRCRPGRRSRPLRRRPRAPRRSGRRARRAPRGGRRPARGTRATRRSSGSPSSEDFPPVVEDHLRAVALEAEGELAVRGHALRQSVALLERAVDEQEAAPSRPADLAAEGAVRAGALVHLLDRGVADAGGQAALELPALVQGLAEAVEVARLERRLELEGERLDPVELREAVGGARALLGEDRVGPARAPGEEEVDPRREAAQVGRGQPQRAGLDRAVPPEAEGPQAAVGGDVLVLLADRLAEPLDLDRAGLA